MLPVVDNLERAIEHAGGGGEKNPIVEGVQLVLRQFTTAFERLEVTAIDALDQPFDPNLHEAISQQESDQPPGTVVQVLQRGYKSGDRLLRPALVVVAKAKPRRGARMHVARRRDRSRHDELLRRGHGWRSGRRDRERRGHAHDALGRRLRRSRASASSGRRRAARR